MEGLEGSFFLFFLFFLYHIFVVKVEEIEWSTSYGENKTQKPKRTNKRNIRNYSLHLGSVPVPGPHPGTKFVTSKSKETLLKPADSMKKYKMPNPSCPETT